MAESIINNNRNVSSYIESDRQVNIQKELSLQKELKESGLAGIEIRKRVHTLGKDDFLKLLITQLTHQDPTEPVKDSQFIAQMAQFSSLEQMQNISSGIAKLSNQQTMSLIGKFVVGKDIAGATRSGVVKAILKDGSGRVLLKVGRFEIPSDDISLIGEPSAFRKEFGGTGSIKNNKPKTLSTKRKEKLDNVKEHKDKKDLTPEKKEAIKKGSFLFERNFSRDKIKENLFVA